MSSGIEQFEKFTENLDKMIKQYPQLKKELYNGAAPIMEQAVKSNISSSTNIKTGNLISGQKKEVGSKGGYAVVKPDWKKAPHTHLLEEGHALVRGGKRFAGYRKGKGYGAGAGSVIGWVAGRHFYQKAHIQALSKIKELANQMENKLGDIMR